MAAPTRKTRITPGPPPHIRVPLPLKTEKVIPDRRKQASKDKCRETVEGDETGGE